MDFNNLTIVLTQVEHFFMSLCEQITGTQLLIILCTLMLFLLSKQASKPTQKKPKDSVYRHRLEPKLTHDPQDRIEELRKRIHNIVDKDQTSVNNLHQSPDLEAPKRNIHADSSYHHAIKLLRSGMDTQKLVEYCNLTHGEAHLLSQLYK